MGSFLLCMAGSENIYSRSKCDHCGHILSATDLIPLFSYLFLKGKCRYCNMTLNIAYPLSELFTGIVYFLFVYKYGLSVKTLMYLILVSIMIFVSIKDIKEMIIPDLAVILGIINYLMFSTDRASGIINSFTIGTMILFLKILMEKIYKKEMMGFGDIKLIYMLGLYTSVYNGLLALLLASICGLVLIVYTKKDIFPFGECICLAYIAVFLFFM